MRKHYLKIIRKTIKFIITNLIICGIVIGVISGLIVTFLFYTPKISLVNTIVKIEDDKYYFEFIYENKGQSPAINIEFISKYLILYKNEIINSSTTKEELLKMEPGDILCYGSCIDIMKVGKVIFENSELFILSKVKYEDSHKFRNFINTRLLNNQYSADRLTFYDVSKKEKSLSGLPLKKRNEFKEIIDEWIEE